MSIRALWHRRLACGSLHRFILTAAIAACAGCGDLNSTLVTKHTSSHRKEDAQEHWNSVRGEVKLQLARQQLEAGRLDEAEKVLTQALAISSKDSQAYILLTKLRLEQGRLVEARQAIGMAASLPSNNSEVPYLAGIVAQRYGELELAAENYTAATRMAPNVPGYVLALAETLVALDRPIDALAWIEGRINDFDTNAPMRILAARVCRIIGLRQPAIDHCREAMRLCPDDAVLAAECGQILVWAERYGDAIGVLLPLVNGPSPSDPSKDDAGKSGVPVALKPVAPSIRRCLATAYLSLGDARNALQAAIPLLDDQDVDSASLLLCAQAAISAGNLDLAVKTFTRMREKTAESPETLLLWAYIAYQRGDQAKAFEVASDAVRLDSGLVAAHCLRGRSAEAIGRLDEAMQSYSDALAVAPDSPVAGSLLAALAGKRACRSTEGVQPIDPARNDEAITGGRFSP